MTCKLNADTSDGLKIVSDTSGTVDIQSNGTTKFSVGSTIDCQGNELVLDADADTSITADTDDQIDFKIAGADCMKINSSGNLVMATGKNLCIGDDDDVVIGRATDNRMTFNTNGVERGRIDENGDFMIGSSSTTGTEKLHVANTDGGDVSMFRTPNSGSTSIIVFRNANGNVGSIKTSSSSTSFNTSSDYRLKENVSYTFDATTRLKQLKPARFNFKADTDTTVDGFLAHEVSSIIPEAISGTKDKTKECVNVVKDSDGTMIHENVTEAEWTQGKTDGTYANDTTWSATATVPVYQSIDQSKLVPLLVKTIQELEARITALES
jgi:hypothetical protein